MSAKTREAIRGALQMLGMLVGFMTVPLVTPILLWFTVAANLSLATVTVLLVSMGVVSRLLTNLTIRICTLGNVSGLDQAAGVRIRRTGTSLAGVNSFRDDL